MRRMRIYFTDVFFCFFFVFTVRRSALHGLCDTCSNYVAAKATYIRLLHGKIGILEGFFAPSSVHRDRTHIVLG